MKKLFFLIFPLFLFAVIIKYQNLKDFYYKNQIVNFQIKIILSSQNKLSIIPISLRDINYTTPNPFVYNINVTFKNSDKNHSIIIIGERFYKQIDLNTLFHTKELSYIPPFFCNVLAKNLSIINPIASKYNNKILLSFTIKCKECNLEDFNLTDNESKLSLISKNKATYYLVLPNKTQFLYFYYFNTSENMFEKITIPIKLKQQTISTQIGLSPEEDEIFTPVNVLLMIIIFFLLIVFLVYRKFVILIFPFLIAVYLIYEIIPKGVIVLKKGTEVRILPTPQSTVIYIINQNETTKILNRVKGYTKIEVKNKIGWVSNENIK